MTKNKIFARLPNWMGDIVMAIPAINALKSVFDGGNVIGYVRTEYAAILKRIGGIDGTIAFRKKNVMTEMAMVQRIKNENFTQAVVFPNSWTSALIPFLSGIPERHGYAVRGRSVLFTDPHALHSEVARKHQVYHYIELVRSISDIQVEERPELVVSEDEVAVILHKYGLSGEKVCGFVPAAAYGEAKCWFPERYGELGRILADRGYKVLLFGAGSDSVRCGEIASMIGNDAVNLAGRSVLDELPVLMKACRFVVANDSGPMHVSAAVNTPVVSLFGSTNPDSTYPFGFRDLVVHHELECSRCLDRNCRKKTGNMRCMELITVSEVLDRLESRGLGR